LLPATSVMGYAHARRADFTAQKKSPAPGRAFRHSGVQCR
jgi:hypothetical protein